MNALRCEGKVCSKNSKKRGWTDGYALQMNRQLERGSLVVMSVLGLFGLTIFLNNRQQI